MTSNNDGQTSSNAGITACNTSNQVDMTSIPVNHFSGGVAYPGGLSPLSHQVAGHLYAEGKLGLLQGKDFTVLKPCQSPPRGERETHFYQQVFDPECDDPVIRQLLTFLPRYIGTWKTPELPGMEYLRLEDVAARFCRPCVADIKMGAVTYDPQATPEKVAREMAKCTSAKKLGFQIRGMRVYNVNDEEFTWLAKKNFEHVNASDTVYTDLARFFNGGQGLRSDVIQEMVRKMRSIVDWFENQTQFAFYSSSLLLVYEGDIDTTQGNQFNKSVSGNEKQIDQTEGYNGGSHGQSCDRNCNSCTGTRELNTKLDENEAEIASKLEIETNGAVGENGRLTEVKMIDFAHVFPSTEKDCNYLSGLKNLVSHLEKLSSL